MKFTGSYWSLCVPGILAAASAVAQDINQKPPKVSVHGACQISGRTGSTVSSICNLDMLGISSDQVPLGKQLVVEHVSTAWELRMARSHFSLYRHRMPPAHRRSRPISFFPRTRRGRESTSSGISRPIRFVFMPEGTRRSARL